MTKKFSKFLSLGFESKDVKTVNNTAPDAAGNVNVDGGGTSPTYEVIEWITGQERPTIEGDKIIGGFFEGKTHFVTTILNGTDTIKIIQPENSLSPFIFLTGLYVYIMSLDADNNVLINGEDITESVQFKRFNSSGIEDQTFIPDPTTVSVMTCFSFLADGKIIVGKSDGVSCLNSDGSLLWTYETPGLIKTVESVILDSTNKILVAGSFTGYLLRLNLDGSLDNTFSPVLSDFVRKILIQPNGKVILTGSPDNPGSIFRLNADGTLDESFSSTVSVMENFSALDFNNKIIVPTVEAPYLYRLNVDGSTDNTFNLDPLIDNYVYRTIPLSSGKYLISGSFTGNIKRLNSDGSIDNSFTCENSSQTSWFFILNDKIFLPGDLSLELYNLNDGSSFETSISFFEEIINRITALEA